MTGQDAEAEHGRALVSRQDVALAIWLGLLLPLSWLVPPRLWTPICSAISRAVVRLNRRASEARVENARHIFGDCDDVPTPREIVVRSSAGRVERQLQYLRELRPGGWNAHIELTGGEHIDWALAQEAGCIIWVGPTLAGYLVTKKGLYGAGYRVTHLSRMDHGGSESLLGRQLNTIRVRPEARYLAERVVMGDGDELRRTRDLYDRLRANALVSITAVNRFGARMVTSSFLGGEWRLPTGAASLSLATGATLLPTIAVRHSYDHFEVIVEPPLTADPSSDRHAAVDELVHRYVKRMEPYAAVHPEQYDER